jgi:hypothetical protein
MKTLQIKLFMQNKAKFRKVKFNVNKVLTRDYEQMDTWSRGTKQSQTNPNKAKSKKAKMNVTSYIKKDYENKLHIRAPKKQSQTSKRQKTMQTSLPNGFMKKTAFSASEKTNPNKPNSCPPSVWRDRGKKMLLCMKITGQREKILVMRAKYSHTKWTQNRPDQPISLSICPFFPLYSGIQTCIFTFFSLIANNEKQQQRSRK